MDERKWACAICGQLVAKLCKDHDHKTGLTRGYLCVNCNNGLGQFKDNTESLLFAIRYLLKNQDISLWFGQQPPEAKSCSIIGLQELSAKLPNNVTNWFRIV